MFVIASFVLRCRVVNGTFSLYLNYVYLNNDKSLQVEPGSCVQRMVGNIKTGVILKDVSMTVHSGEVLAVLGSKGKCRWDAM